MAELALATRSMPVLRTVDGRLIEMDVRRWTSAADAIDEEVLSRAVSPVLDVGCGPGRHVLSLCRAGALALGVDAAPSAVQLAHRHGAPVLMRSVFGDLPGQGRWASALLLDGNVGIGGAPHALVRRLRELLSPGGTVLVELEAPGSESEALTVRLEHEGRCTGWFPWATVAFDDAARLAADAGFELRDAWHGSGRWFAQLDAIP